MNAPPAARRIKITTMIAINVPDADDADRSDDADVAVGVDKLP